MKKFVFLLTIVLSLGFSAQAAPIYRYTEDIPISDSIMLTKVQEFHSDKSISYSCITADLENENTDLKLLTPAKGPDVLDTVANLTSTEENVVAALNADFFSTAPNGGALSLGIEATDGILAQSPIYPDTMATISYLNKAVDMSYINFKITVTAPNGATHEIRHLNKHTAYFGDILMYTSDLASGYSPAPGGDVVEMVVSDGVVSEFRRNMPAVEIPKDGYVLVVSEGSDMFLANNFAVGDAVDINIEMPSDLYSADALFGGGAMLVENGQKLSEYSHVIAGYQPRSAIGIDQSGKTLYLVAVDGRQDSSRGMSMSELADLMLSLGAYKAVNLDGGGSTNMQASTVWYETMHKVNSPTENRRVINAVGLTYDNTSSTRTPSGIMLENEKNAVLSGDSVKITSAVYDENQRPLDSGLIAWASQSGSVEKGVFTPTKAGKAIVSAAAGDAYAETELFVIDKVTGIDVPSHIRLTEGKTSTLDISVFDNDGHYTAVKDGTLLDITSSDNSVVSVSGRTLTALKSGSAIITLKKGNAVSYISVVVGDGKLVPAPLNRYDTPSQGNGDVFAVGALQTKTDNMLSILLNATTAKELSLAKSSFMLGSNQGFTAKEDENALYITLDTSKGGIRKSDSAAWDKLISAISASGKPNVFLLSDNTLSSGSELENKAIAGYLSSLGKNVFVITKGERNTYKNIGGVEYFTLADTDKELLNMTTIENAQILEFYFGEKVTFNWRNLY